MSPTPCMYVCARVYVSVRMCVVLVYVWAYMCESGRMCESVCLSLYVWECRYVCVHVYVRKKKDKEYYYEKGKK